MRQVLAAVMFGLVCNCVFAQVDLAWVNPIASNGPSEVVHDIALDTAGNSFVAGHFSGTLDFDPGPGVAEFTSAIEDPFLAKYASDGSLIWVKHFVGRGQLHRVALAADGSFAITGEFTQSLQLDSTTTITPTSASVQGGRFVAKFDASGALLWVFSLTERNAITEVTAFAVDGAGSVIIGGTTRQQDFDPSPATFLLSPAVSGPDSYLAKYSANGNFAWAKMFQQQVLSGSGQSESLSAIALDGSDTIYAVGLYKGTTRFSPTITLSAAAANAYLAKLAADGTLAWVKTTDSSVSAEHSGIGMDALGNIYISGLCRGATDFDPDPVLQSVRDCQTTAYLVSYNNAGDLRWHVATQSPTINDYANFNDLAVTADGVSSVGGLLRGQVDFDPGAGTLEFQAQAAFDPFFAQYDNNGNLINAYHLRGTINGMFNGSTILAVAANDADIWVGGRQQLTLDFDPGPAQSLITPLGAIDGFVAKYSAQNIFSNGFEP